MATARSRNRSVPVQLSGWRDANPRFDISGASLSADLLLWRTRPLGAFPYVILDARVARIFPNEASLLRLLPDLLAETSDEWEFSKSYLDMNPSSPPSS